jgi:hydrogenase nickel incorporation protein HypB
MERLPVETKVLQKNEDFAQANRSLLESFKIASANLMSAPGAGKTSVLERTLPALKRWLRMAVVEGDLYTSLDSERIRASGVEAFQITTGTCCHLDARMISRALDEFSLWRETELLIIENVGNLVCPAEFDLGEDLRIMVYSVVEGAEKPQKYPLMFRLADAVLLNKIDLLPHTDVSLEELKTNVRKVNPTVPIFPVSCRTGAGFERWNTWLLNKVLEIRKQEAAVCV